MKTTKTLLAIFLFALLSSATYAQTRRYVGVELLGTYNLVGISFDTRLAPSSQYGVKFGLGYGYEKTRFEFTDTKNTIYLRTSPIALRGLRMKQALSLPITLYRLFGGKRHFFELGIGVVPYYATFGKYDDILHGLIDLSHYNGFNYYGHLQTAYRYERNRFLLSVGIDIPFKMPKSGFKQAIGLYPKLSIGYKL